MKFLRTASTHRLLAAVAGALVAIVAGTAIAIAAAGSGPVPARKPLARAIHDAMASPAVSGISARVTFTNHLIDAGNVQGIDPLLQGGSGRLWTSPGHGLRLELQSDNGDAQLVLTNGRFWAYDPTSNTIYRGSLPADNSSAKKKDPSKDGGLPTIAQIQSAITQLSGHANVSRAVPGDIAGHPAYTVTVRPATGGGLLGGAALAFDAVRGVPLRFAIFARGDSTPVLELKATDISYGKVAASVFSITAPKDAKVVNVSLPTGAGAGATHQAKKKGAKHHADVTGAKAVAKHLRFALDAPATLAGLARSSVALQGKGADAGALITYGQGLGGIYVIEHPASGKHPSPATSSTGQSGLSLPTASVRGASATVLPTALGTVVSFTRGGVSYTVLGSVSQATAERAARGL